MPEGDDADDLGSNVDLESRLIDDLLDLTRIARGRIDLDRRASDLLTILQRAVEVCRPDTEARQPHFGVDADASGYPASTFGSKDQLVASYLERKTKDARASIEAYLAGTPPSQRALKFFDWVGEWAESKDFRGCPLQHTVSELTDAAHPARAIAHDQRAWFAERLREWTTAAGVRDAKATARALMVLFDGAVAGSEVDGPQRAGDARWVARKLLAG